MGNLRLGQHLLQTEAAESQVISAEIAAQHLPELIKLESAKAYLDYQTATASVAVARDAAAQAEEAHHLETVRYEAG